MRMVLWPFETCDVPYKVQWQRWASACLTRCIIAQSPILDIMNSAHTTAMEALGINNTAFEPDYRAFQYFMHAHE